MILFALCKLSCRNLIMFFPSCSLHTFSLNKILNNTVNYYGLSIFCAMGDCIWYVCALDAQCYDHYSYDYLSITKSKIFFLTSLSFSIQRSSPNWIDREEKFVRQFKEVERCSRWRPISLLVEGSLTGTVCVLQLLSITSEYHDGGSLVLKEITYYRIYNIGIIEIP